MSIVEARPAAARLARSCAAMSSARWASAWARVGSVWARSGEPGEDLDIV